MSSEISPKVKHPQNQKLGNKDKVDTQKQQGNKSKVETQKIAESIKPNVADKKNQLSLFDDLPRMKTNINFNSIEGDGGGIHKLLHPTTLKLGLLYRNGQIKEDDDRVLSLLQCFINIISDYSTPSNKNLSWDLDKHIRAQVQHLVDCRQHSMGMGNLIKSLRYSITQIPPDLSEAEAKKNLISSLNTFLEERIIFARESISRYVTSTIRDGDVILTFGSSPTIRQVLLHLSTVKSFKLIVVDTRPLKDGLETLIALSPKIECVYTSLSGAASCMKQATKVILGASGLMSNGAMLAPAGTAMIASLAKNQRVPVLVAAESYKFCEKVQLDSIVHNELGSSNEISMLNSIITDENKQTIEMVATPVIDATYKGTAERNSNLPFSVINLRYDLTPIGNISVVATETGLIPPTSIPVLIRELRTDNNDNSNIED